MLNGKENDTISQINTANSRQSHIAELQNKWEALTVAALQVAAEVNPFQADLPVGTVIPAVSAVGWPKGHRNCDVRPRLVDKQGTSRLVDSGSQVTTTSRIPGDKKDSQSRLLAVNGSKIETYGVREINIKINRKNYSIPAIVCDMGQDILGMDFINKYRLGLEWDDFDQTELYLVDKKADLIL